MWTRFMDMHSGGRTKEPPYEYIYIEAPEDQARAIFYNRFGHNPDRVTCTCCGEDYSVSEEEDLAQLTGFDRGCRNLKTPQYRSGPRKGLYKNDDPVIKSRCYLEEGEEPPAGYEVDDRFSQYRTYQTLEQYLQNENVLVIRATEIKPEERLGEIPTQGYVWVE